MRNLLEGRRLNLGKWLGWLVALGTLVLVVWYAYSIKSQLWFTITTPRAVSSCIEGYQGEHGEADRKFELKQKSEVVSPLPDDLKEVGQ